MLLLDGVELGLTPLDSVITAARCTDSLVDFHTGDELPEALITAVDVHQFDWRACVDGLVAEAPSDDDEA